VKLNKINSKNYDSNSINSVFIINLMYCK